MKITDVQTILLTVASKWLWGSRPRTFSFVRVSTDAGLTGLGETLLGFYVPELVSPLTEHFRNVIVGEDPRDIHRLWRKMFVKAMRWGHVGPPITVLGAIEVALWDILAKSLDVPVYQLLGGKAHQRLRCYASTGCPACSPLEKTLAARARSGNFRQSRHLLFQRQQDRHHLRRHVGLSRQGSD